MEGNTMGTELFTPEVVHNVINAGKLLISSPAVDGVVTALMTTLFLRKGEQSKTVETLKVKQFEKVLDELLETGRLSYVELYRCRNFLKIAKCADNMIMNQKNDQEQKEDYEEDEINFDWIMRFFDAVGNISNEDLQLLWGKVLANEIKKPKSCSLRTLDIIRNMSPEEAKTFSVLCRYVMQSGNTYYLDSAGFFCEEDGHQECRNYIKHKGLSYEEHIIPLLEAGALSQDHDLALYMNKNIKLEIYNDEICGLIMNFEEDPVLFRRDIYLLTASGKELYQIIHNSEDFKTERDYALLCLRDMKNENPVFYVGAFEQSVKGQHRDLLEEA